MRHRVHPWLHEQRIVLRRRLMAWRDNAAPRRGRLLLLGALLAGLAFAAQASAAPLSALGLRAISTWPLPITLLLATAGGALLRSRLLAVSESWRTGWWAAAPLDPRVTTHTLVVLALAAAIIAMLAAAAALTWLAWLAGDARTLQAVIPVAAGGILGGAALGLASALRARRRCVTAPKHAGIRRPLFATAWLEDRHLPHLLDWQRRDTVRRWRTGGNAPLLGLAFALLPAGMGLHSTLALVVLAFLVVWLRVALHACAASTRAASQLLAATPACPRQFARAALRYPLFATACSLVPALLVIAVGGMSATGWWLWCAVTLALTFKPWRQLLPLIRRALP